MSNIERLSVTGTITLLLLMVFSGTMCNAFECHNSADVMGKESKYDAVSGCFIKVNNRWVPMNTYREVEE